MSDKLSVIIPFCNEYPQILFTIQCLLNDLDCSFAGQYEVIVVDNYTPEVGNQKTGEELCQVCMHPIDLYRKEDLGGAFLKGKSEKLPGLRYVSYRHKLSHWQAKNEGVKAATGDIFLFLDAHVVPSASSIWNMYSYYLNNYDIVNGTIHLPLCYLLSGPGLQQEIIYKFVCNPEKGFYHYQFSPYQRQSKPYKVAAMSTCGMMISREVFDLLGGWPSELGIYGGGENFVNYTLAVLGKEKTIFTTQPLYHFAASRGYFFNYDDFIRNRTIATHIFAGQDAARRFTKNCQGDPVVLNRIYQSAISGSVDHKRMIDDRKQTTIEEWMEKIKEDGLWDGTLSNKEYVS